MSIKMKEGGLGTVKALAANAPWWLSSRTLRDRNITRRGGGLYTVFRFYAGLTDDQNADRLLAWYEAQKAPLDPELKTTIEEANARFASHRYTSYQPDVEVNCHSLYAPATILHRRDGSSQQPTIPCGTSGAAKLMVSKVFSEGDVPESQIILRKRLFWEIEPYSAYANYGLEGSAKRGGELSTWTPSSGEFSYVDFVAGDGSDVMPSTYLPDGTHVYSPELSGYMVEEENYLDPAVYDIFYYNCSGPLLVAKACCTMDAVIATIGTKSGDLSDAMVSGGESAWGYGEYQDPFAWTFERCSSFMSSNEFEELYPLNIRPGVNPSNHNQVVLSFKQREFRQLALLTVQPDREGDKAQFIMPTDVTAEDAAEHYMRFVNAITCSSYGAHKFYYWRVDYAAADISIGTSIIGAMVDAKARVVVSAEGELWDLMDEDSRMLQRITLLVTLGSSHADSVIYPANDPSNRIVLSAGSNTYEFTAQQVFGRGNSSGTIIVEAHHDSVFINVEGEP